MSNFFQFTLAEQLGNIGSEVGRAGKWQGKDEGKFMGAVQRALGLFDMMLADPRWKGRRLEVARTREIFCDAVFGGGIYKIDLAELDKYFMHFAIAARNGK